MPRRPDLSILIATVGYRNRPLRRLLDCLAPQVDAYAGRVKVLLYWDNFESTLGDARQALLDRATGRYVCFVDDDDEVPDYYVDRIVPLLGQVDYVGWRMQLYRDGDPQKPTFHSIRYPVWSDDDDGYYRNVSHLNPIRREIARLGRFDKDVPEDVNWSEQVRAYVRTEAFIDDPMYFYLWSPAGSLWSMDRKPRGIYRRPRLPSRHMRFHPGSSRGGPA